SADSLAESLEQNGTLLPHDQLIVHHDTQVLLCRAALQKVSLQPVLIHTYTYVYTHTHIYLYMNSIYVQLHIYSFLMSRFRICHEWILHVNT
uniref:Uncharacterized protein n=1 Tax=Nothoprocta perdicaria TaxID=30464 RepID=A0A8C6ZUG7_NOTPE